MVKWKNHFSYFFNVHGFRDVRQTYVQQNHEASDFEMATEKLKSHKFPGIDEIPAEFIKAEVRTIRSEVHQLINYIWVKEELHEEWKESVILPIYKKGEKTDCGNYRSISLLSTTYNILSNILLSRLTQYAEKTIGDHQCGFRHNRLTTDHIFCVHQILEKKMGTKRSSESSLHRLQESL